MKNSKPLDDLNTKLMQQAQQRRIKGEGSIPRQGDVLRYPDGYIRRVAHAYDDGCQPAAWGGQGSIYISPHSGIGSYSGALDPSIPHSVLTLADERMDQTFWFFSHDSAGAGRGIDCQISVRVWEVSIEDTNSRRMGE